MSVSEEPARPWRTLYISAVLGGGGAMSDVEAAIRTFSRMVRQRKRSGPTTPPGREPST